MRKNQEQLLKALEGHIPADARDAVEKAATEFVESIVADLEADKEEEYKATLEEAFEEHQKELNEAEKIAEESYAKAWSIISDLRDRLEIQAEEFNTQLKEEYEVAYSMIQEERAKNDSLETDLHEYYEKRYKDVREFMVDKLDLFLQKQDEKYYEAVRKDLMDDSTVLEHKVAFDKILDIAGNFLGDEDRTFATTSKVEGLAKELDDLKGKIKIVEGKNMRLSMENDKLNEVVRKSEKMLTESAGMAERKNRLEKAKQVEGRGDVMLDRKVVIGEQKDEPAKNSRQGVIAEQVGEQIFQDWKHLAGISTGEDK